jgi:hypothetical protein
MPKMGKGSRAEKRFFNELRIRLAVEGHVFIELIPGAPFIANFHEVDEGGETRGELCLLTKEPIPVVNLFKKVNGSKNGILRNMEKEFMTEYFSNRSKIII